MGFASILAFNLGAKNHARVLKLYNTSFWFIIIVISALCLILIILSKPLTMMFSRDEGFIKIGT